MRELTWQARNAANPQRANWSTHRREETRQEYANARVRMLQHQFIAANEVLPFDVLLLAFCAYGEFYDAGQRLSDLQVAA